MPILRRSPTAPFQESQLLRWKLGHYFDCMDTDNDRRLTRADYELAALRLSRAFKFRPESRPHRRLRTRFRTLWELHGPPTDGQLDKTAFIEGNLAALRDSPRSVMTSLSALSCSLADIADIDGDSVVSEREYRTLLRAAFGLTAEIDLRAAYGMLDRDGSGMLEHDEIHAAVEEYFTSNDPHAPGNWLLGPPPAEYTADETA